MLQLVICINYDAIKIARTRDKTTYKETTLTECLPALDI